MPLKTYRRKRDFTHTHEPRGERETHPGFSFVVQRHDARSLHFDFRLELDGVLLSWAVPKGPSDDPSEKRLAMQTEDHPVEYSTFEGTIPEGEYGAGTVEIWDRGRWQPLGDPRQMYEQGRLHFELFGERLHGGWHLVRTRSVKGAGKGNKRPSWLLFKAKDVPHADRISSKRQTAARRAPRDSVGSRARQTFALSNPDKVLYPEPGYTKLDLANYYSTVAQWILPHVVGRPLTLVRCPNGCDKPCFFQKHPSGAKVEGVRVVSLPEKSKQADYVVIDDLRGLLSLVQWGALEIHTGGAQAVRPNYPELMVFDLDPDLGLPFSAVTQAALKTRQLLKERGLTSFVKTTGGKGLHVCVPLDESRTFEQTVPFSRSVAEALVHSAPDHYVASMSKSKRSGKVFIDYLRNGRGATFIASYSTRKHPSAPVAMPLHWDELDVDRMPQYTLANAARRLAQLKEDPWRAIQTMRQALPLLAP